jgi:arsenate reductase
MATRRRNALFLCTGNSARSILAEAILERLGDGRIRAFSAGSHPAGKVHPLTVEVLREHGHDVARFRSKSWEEFETPGAPALDLILTVCDRAAAEACPIWPGNPTTAHWGLSDPAVFEGTDEDRLALFRRTYADIEHRIERLMKLPIESLDREELARSLNEIGGSPTSVGREC